MAVCPKCQMTFTYTEDHVCEGHDRAKLWLMASVAGGAVVGGLLGLFYGLSHGRRACSEPDASNLCGLADIFAPPLALPLYVAVGAVIAILITGVAAVMISAVMSRRSRA